MSVLQHPIPLQCSTYTTTQTYTGVTLSICTYSIIPNKTVTKYIGDCNIREYWCIIAKIGIHKMVLVLFYIL